MSSTVAKTASTDDPNCEMSSRELFERLFTYVVPHWKIFSLGLLAMIVLALTEPAIPYFLKPMIDGSFVEKDPYYIKWMPIALIGIFLVRGASSYVSTMAFAWVGGKVVYGLRCELFDRLNHLPTVYFEDNPSGNIMSKLTFNVTQVTTMATHVITVLVKDTLIIIGLIAWMLYLDWQLTLITFVMVPFIAGVVHLLNIRMRGLSRSLQDSVGDMTHIIEESIRGNRVVKVFNGHDYEQQRFEEKANWLRRYQMKVQSAAAINVPVVQTIAAVVMGLIIFLAADGATENEVTIGGFISFLAAMGMLFSPIKRLTGLTVHIQRGMAAAETVFELLDTKPEKDAGTQRIEKAKGQIDFVDVVYRYPEADKDALKSISFSIQSGETYALVGASGSGKSTVAGLLPRFFTPTSGQVLLDGIDTQDLALKNLRDHISLVSQDIVLFNDTVEANISYGLTKKPSKQRIREVLDLAYASEFVDRLPNGLQTELGNDGVRLSGGQRQRIAIARALLKDPPVLVLDEATAALDTASEKHVQKALENLKVGRSTLVIAHRLSTIENADQILVMKDGLIVERGHHQALLEQSGLYAGLYNSEIYTG